MTETYCEWAEELPEDCPPSDAHIPEDKEFYRFADNYPVKESDFLSYYAIHGNKPSDVTICRSRSLSIRDSFEDCLKARLLPNLKKMKIIKILLTQESGLILQTGENPHHFSWWRCRDFDYITNSEPVEI